MAKKAAAFILVSLPVTGHLPVTIELAKRLMNHDRRVKNITILSWRLPFTSPSSSYSDALSRSHPDIDLVDLPEIEDPPPLDLYTRVAEAYIYRYIIKALPVLREIISALVSSYHASGSVHVVGLVLDFFSNPLIDVGDDLNIPSYILLTCSAGFLGLMKYLSERHRRVASEFDDRSCHELLSIPGFDRSVPVNVMPPRLFQKDSHEAYVKLAERFKDAKGILVNTFTDLEPHAIDYFSREENYPPVYVVGPVVNLENRPNPNIDPVEHDMIMRWLDEQHESSVVFFCFGSKGVLDSMQVKEIALGLESCGCRFLWSIRTNPMKDVKPYDLLPDGFMGRVTGRGVVCGWAPQVEVLSHKAVGGFVSHCGWNSILESLWFGVPIATWPMYAEQHLNAFTMTKELGLAVELRLDYVSGHGSVVIAEEISRAVRSVMNGGDSRREKVKEMAGLARKALMDGGSSFSAVSTFLRELLAVDPSS
ncbi:PREDICTED: UDP-glycosyltransferase 71C4-like isoform X1 [Tarenaya hassleriana]|uniref:UDP-glycosyltransferase 71C4-like isoform X1 n=1 Tax=Tarenaya hassleriana TaxID=28532 RepID=UPI00053C853D|nr:PREDICTED: UDP-glycosyltransferase 71C4-like isoform X1 [Tarenaya hassleriana]XP_010521935.1 PREDICTED: UDP-glycosyltransferase 71C4-like isoform X1 [Tarenaya hassleriana]